ncbi:movement protein [Chickpea leafroll virus]|uniref:Movement protein n=1 Tax=Chickpea leafroll virus TaxID=2989852 RepID=A0AAE9T993_9VIRU|nr:movement protein [Chickpea leafroll virus]
MGGKGEIGNLAGLLQGATQWLWSKPLGQHLAEEDDDDEVVGLIEEQEDHEQESLAKHSCFQRTTSREVPVEQSRSGRLWQTAQLSVLEYSRPTMSTRSQMFSFSSSQRPLPPPRVPSLMNLTPIAKTRAYSPQSTNLVLPRMDNARLLPALSMDSNGTTLPRTNSASSTKGMDRPRSRDRSGSLSKC